tara:strand:- start:639 stop:923 length:285 start_codon:yes stop_codon:yes gene_type:complete
MKALILFFLVIPLKYQFSVNTKTIRDILIREKLLKNCKLIIGIDKVMTPKPNHEPFKYIQSLIKNGKSLYIGDKETDQQFANAAKLDFIFVDNF